MLWSSTALRSWSAVGVGGVCGALCRWGISEAIGDHPIDWATLVVNILGCFALGLVVHGVASRPPGSGVEQVRLALGVGFCGALTTFSGFAVAVAEDLSAEHALRGSSYLVATITACLVAALAGRAATARVRAPGPAFDDNLSGASDG